MFAELFLKIMVWNAMQVLFTAPKCLSNLYVLLLSFIVFAKKNKKKWNRGQPTQVIDTTITIEAL